MLDRRVDASARCALPGRAFVVPIEVPFAGSSVSLRLVLDEPTQVRSVGAPAQYPATSAVFRHLKMVWGLPK